MNRDLVVYTFYQVIGAQKGIGVECEKSPI